MRYYFFSLFITITTFSMLSYANPVSEVLNVVESTGICEDSGITSTTMTILKNLGLDVSDIRKTVCEGANILSRANGVIISAEGGLEQFLNSALTDGYSLFSDITGVQYDMSDIQAGVDTFFNIANNGLGLEEALNYIASATATNYFKSLLKPSVATEGSVQQQLEDLPLTNPSVMINELRTIREATEIQGNIAQTVTTATQSQQLALDAFNRADEATIMTNATNIDPTNLGNAEIAEQRANRAVSTRAAVQALVDAQASTIRQEALNTTALLTSIKELGVQQSYTVEQLSRVATSLYQEQLESAQSNRDQYERILERQLQQTNDVAEVYSFYGNLLKGFSESLGE